MDGNIEELQKELDDIYVRIGSASSEDINSVLDEVLDRMTELELLITPPLPMYELPIKCGCHRRDCWECVYEDDPEGI